MKLHVAVVDRVGQPYGKRYDYRSGRDEGDWAAFTGENRADVIERALKARNQWGRDRYRVLVGELTGEVREPMRYEVVDLLDPIPF